ncbi:hypothetical protein CCACVL1_08614 [Corchorus capsularis]|uniref:TIR domain-containing protein n=1 Tax=Corchorus capsularis TaxID=210143 RepID=A0A1R3IZH0_COCAP|nr:hypothetical protein CCACVL1_08614 [Corchorus capsularis]
MKRKFSEFSSSPSSSSSSSAPHQWRFKHQIFLSFCGDTRKTFTDHLFNALINKGIETFRDEESLEKGEELTPALLGAIGESWASIIVFSKGYASSRWCLKELAEIMKKRKERGLGVYPIFYDVDPSDLRNQRNSVEEAFKKHETNKKISKEEMQSWRRGLGDVPEIIGWDNHKKDQHEAKFLERIVENITKLISKEYPAESISLLPSKGIIPSKSAELAGGQIMEALKDDGVNIIGLWGMGGVGKTTLVKEVGRQAKESKLFAEVVIVTVSQNPNIGKLQKEIAESLKLTLNNKTDVGRREQLCAALLQKKESILIILDDLWRELDLMEVGILFDELQHKGCKILLTTRFERVCSDMGSGKVVWLDVLDKDEAWQLFKSCAKLDDDASDNILKMAAEVAKECKGLPIALSSLGNTLKGARLHKWREAIENLRHHTLLDMVGVEEDEKNAYKCLKLSYDFLRLDNTKKCFLLCSLYPEDHSIPIEELVRHVWGLELFKGRNSIQKARDAVYTAVDHLKACSLLLDDDKPWNKNRVKMHDMVRDVALWIGSQKETMMMMNHFVIKSELGAKEWPRSENFEQCTAISFMHCNIKGIPQGLQYPKLEFLSFRNFFFHEKKTMMFSGSSFEGMKSLKVLNLVRIKGSLSQDALQMLTNLRSLYLECCEINTYISFSSLGNLKKLEILSFCDSDIEVLPDEVGELKSLRLLDLSWCERLKRIPPNVIGRLSQLEELYLGLCGFKFDEWVVEGSTDAEVRNASLFEELNKLPRLTILVLEVGDSERVPEDFVFPELQNYTIAIGGYAHEAYPSRPYLKIQKTTSLHAFENLFEEVELLELNSIVNFQSLVDARNYQHVPVTFSNLSVLKIESMNCFKGLCNGQPPRGFLKKLETLEITRCGSVKSVFPPSVTKNLVQLKSVKIVDCDMLKQIFEGIEGGNDHKVLQKLETLEVRGCGNLKSLFPPPVARNLVQLKSVKITTCDVLEQIFDEGMEGDNDRALSKLETLKICGSLKSVFPLGVAKMLVQLKSLNIDGCHKLEQIFEEILEGADEVLQKLESLEIRRCSSLKSLFPQSVAEKLVQLKLLHIEDCDMLEKITEEMEVDDGEILSASTPYLLPNLETLKIGDCAKLECLIDTRKQHLPAINAVSNLEELELTGMTSLKWVFNGDCPKGLLHKLQTLKISKCGSMTSLFPLSFARNLLQLKKLEIEDCDMLERLVLEDDNFIEMLSNNHPHPPCLQELEEVAIRRCCKLEYVFPSSLVGNLNLPRLRYLWLENLFELKEIERDGNDVCLNLPISLKDLHLSGCPKLRPFIVSSTHQMEWISIEGAGSEQLWNNNNPVVAQGRLENSSNMEYAVIGNHVEQMFHLHQSGNNILSNLWWLAVQNLAELRVIWRTSRQLVTLQNLGYITVVGCKSLRYVFSPLLAPSLPKLEYLEINGCEDLEQIVDTSSPSSSLEDHHDLQSLSFPNLERIKIESCNNLKYVFPISIFAHLQRLRSIEISKAWKLEQVFGSGKDDDHQQEKVLQLPQLKWLSLEELPSLISFSSVDYHFLFPSLKVLKVRDCRQMTTTFSIDSQSRVHAKPLQRLDVLLPELQFCDVLPPQVNGTVKPLTWQCHVGQVGLTWHCHTRASQQIEDSAAAQKEMWARGSDIEYSN